MLLKYRLYYVFICFSLLVFATFIIGCRSNNGNFDVSEMEGLYCVNTFSEVFYIHADKSRSTAHSAFCFSDNGSSCDSIPVIFDGNYLVSAKNNKKIALFRAKEDDVLVRFPTSNMPEKEYPLLKFETPWNNISIEKSPLKRYINSIPDSKVTIQEDIIYDNKKGFYSELSTQDVLPADYAGYIKKVAETFENTTLKNGVVPLDLKLDIYYPQNDTISKRPLIVMAHGGAFLFGGKQSPLMTLMAKDFAQRGYVVASINYRLGTTLLGLDAIERTIYRAVQDYRNATRFLINNANLYGIDTTAVFYIGHSAGAVTALTASTMKTDEVYSSVDANFFRDNLGDIPQFTKTKGVVALWGGITDLNIIDNEDKVDMLLFHGTEDDVIPFYSGIPFKCVTGNIIHRVGSYFAQMYGSATIEERMHEENLSCKLHAFKNMKHDLHLNPDGSYNENMQIVLDTTISYLYEKLKDTNPRIIEKKTGKNTAIYNLDRNELNLLKGVKWDVVGGAIVAQSSADEIEVCWFTNAPSKRLKVTVKTESGIVLEGKFD